MLVERDMLNYGILEEALEKAFRKRNPNWV
jgi:hypothetical protein